MGPRYAPFEIAALATDERGQQRLLRWFDEGSDRLLREAAHISPPSADNAEDFKASVAAVGSPTNAKQVSGRNGGLKIDWAKPP